MFATRQNKDIAFTDLYFMVLQNFSFKNNTNKAAIGKEFLKVLCKKACQAYALGITVQEQLLEQIAEQIGSMFPSTQLKDIMCSLGNYYQEFGFGLPPFCQCKIQQFVYCRKNCFLFTEKGLFTELRAMINHLLANKQAKRLQSEKLLHQAMNNLCIKQKQQSNPERKFIFLNRQRLHERILQINFFDWPIN